MRTAVFQEDPEELGRKCDGSGRDKRRLVRPATVHGAASAAAGHGTSLDWCSGMVTPHIRLEGV